MPDGLGMRLSPRMVSLVKDVLADTVIHECQECFGHVDLRIEHGTLQLWLPHGHTDPVIGSDLRLCHQRCAPARYVEADEWERQLADREIRRSRSDLEASPGYLMTHTTPELDGEHLVVLGELANDGLALWCSEADGVRVQVLAFEALNAAGFVNPGGIRLDALPNIEGWELQLTEQHHFLAVADESGVFFKAGGSSGVPLGKRALDLIDAQAGYVTLLVSRPGTFWAPRRIDSVLDPTAALFADVYNSSAHESKQDETRLPLTAQRGYRRACEQDRLRGGRIPVR
ncbi:hypothetical protein ACFV84_36130 [Kitasatospora sp. NPDC059811]|uniref:hypothetical protein n=1 Tax=Streptomycetaceae TaxID=2062 RepID=UPI001331B6EB|nr:hypothetical protein [Streptomyces sp. MJM8645]